MLKEPLCKSRHSLDYGLVVTGKGCVLGRPADRALTFRKGATPRCAFSPGCSYQQLRGPLLEGEATQDHVAPEAVMDPQVGLQ